jgi:hypothetical protein
MWHVLLNTVKQNKVVRPEDNPTKSGEYLCTCISKEPFKEIYYRYLRVMEYNAENKCWHDIGHEGAISHTILAWTETELCDFSDFKWDAGYLFKKRTRKK